MTVQELIEALASLPPQLEVLVEDGCVALDGDIQVVTTKGRAPVVILA